MIQSASLAARNILPTKADYFEDRNVAIECGEEAAKDRDQKSLEAKSVARLMASSRALRDAQSGRG